MPGQWQSRLLVKWPPFQVSFRGKTMAMLLVAVVVATVSGRTLLCPRLFGRRKFGALRYCGAILCELAP